MSVSYTHLDVYKRQVSNIAEFQMLLMEFTAMRSINTVQRPQVKREEESTNRPWQNRRAERPADNGNNSWRNRVQNNNEHGRRDVNLSLIHI